MKLSKIRKGEYLGTIAPGMNIWVIRQDHTRKWVWFIGGYDARQGTVWETDDNGPFPTLKDAIADAIANYQEIFLD